MFSSIYCLISKYLVKSDKPDFITENDDCQKFVFKVLEEDMHSTQI